MSLLVTFFVMLIAFSNVEKEKLMEMIGAMKGALGMCPDVRQMAGLVEPPKNYERIRGLAIQKKWLSINELSAVIPDAQMAVSRFGKPKVGNSTAYVLVRMLDKGMAFIIHTRDLFERGSAAVMPANDELFAQIGHLVSELENEIRVVGVVTEQTDVSKSEARTPLGLGIERALAVKGALAMAAGLSEERFAIGSRLSVPGEYARDPEVRAERMEIIVIGKRDLTELSPEEIVVRDKWE